MAIVSVCSDKTSILNTQLIVLEKSFVKYCVRARTCTCVCPNVTIPVPCTEEPFVFQSQPVKARRC